MLAHEMVEFFLKEGVPKDVEHRFSPKIDFALMCDIEDEPKLALMFMVDDSILVVSEDDRMTPIETGTEAFKVTIDLAEKIAQFDSKRSESNVRKLNSLKDRMSAKPAEASGAKADLFEFLKHLRG